MPKKATRRKPPPPEIAAIMDEAPANEVKAVKLEDFPLEEVALRLLDGFGILDEKLKAKIAEIGANEAIYQPIKDAIAAQVSAKLGRDFLKHLAQLAGMAILKMVQEGESNVDHSPVDLA